MGIVRRLIMFDLSKEFNKFYSECTVLPQSTQNDLRNKKTLNIDRLKAGLNELNDENGTSYSVSDIKEQGSIAMSTVVQNDDKDYDIDIAVIFDEENIGSDTGTTTIKHIVTNALKKKCSNFKKAPEALTNCVRIEYADGYHVDFAIYKKTSDGTYYHAGSSWQERNPMSIKNWFSDAVKNKGDKLRSVVRLSKMFCKSRSSWQMPGGLIQSVLCDECFVEYERLDECFYYTMKGIIKRLEESIEVYNPTDGTKSLLLKQKDRDKMNNWKQRLSDKLDKIDVILKSDCTKKQAFDSWYKVFNHDFWLYSDNEFTQNSYANVVKSYTYASSEEYIRNKYKIDINYSARIDCNVEANGFRSRLLSHILKCREWLPKSRTLTFYCETDTPAPYEVLWKIRNVGFEAERRKMIRGEIIRSNYGRTKRREHTDFEGPHFVECYIIKNDVCVAIARIDVPIK